MSFLAYQTGSHEDFLKSGRRLYQHSITNSAKHSSKTYHRAGQRCFELLTLISHSQVRYIHLPERMILPGSLILSDKYILKNLTFVVRSHSCVYVTTLVKSFTWPGRRSIIKKQCPSWPTGREVVTTSSCRVGGYVSTPSPTVQSTPEKRIVEWDSAVSGH